MKVQEIADQREITSIQKFIKDNYETMYATWRTLSSNGFYENK